MQVTRVITPPDTTGQTELMLPKFCWYKDGIILLNPLGQIKHYNRSKNWKETFELKPKEFKQLLVLRDHLYGWFHGRLFDIDIENQTYNLVINLTSDTVDFDIIYPLGEAFVSYSLNNDLQTWDCKTGTNVRDLRYVILCYMFYV